MKRLVLAATVLLALVSVSRAETLPLGSDTLDNLLGGSAVEAGSLMTTDMSNGVLVANVLSQAYTVDNSLYAYLYQINNTGSASDTAVQEFTLWPFNGGDDQTETGCLIGTLPTGFATGGQLPEDGVEIDFPSDSPVMSFYFKSVAASEIAPGEHSQVMYVLSDLAPDVIIGNLIGGSIGTGPVVGPKAVPEPATAICLILGAVSLVFLVRRS